VVCPALFPSLALLAELARILRRAKFAQAIAASGASLDDLVLGYAQLATLVTPAAIPTTVRNDPSDDHILACALAAPADLIVSGDAHLLNLKTFHRISIITAAEAIDRITLSR
jgi:predicted nucleic acid-binding protein